MDNRDHFRRWIPDRGDDYCTIDGVTASLDAARQWWEAGTDLLHVVADRDGTVAARANLVDIDGGCAAVGYRVGLAHEGQGIGTAVVAALLGVAAARGIVQVSAETASTNPASARVLQKCGFVRVGARPAALQLGDVMLDATDWLAGGLGS